MYDGWALGDAEIMYADTITKGFLKYPADLDRSASKKGKELKKEDGKYPATVDEWRKLAKEKKYVAVGFRTKEHPAPAEGEIDFRKTCWGMTQDELEQQSGLNVSDVHYMVCTTDPKTKKVTEKCA